MRIIKPSFEIWDQEEGLEGIYKQIERCGRVCYASDPVEGKAKDFVDRMIKLGHGAMLEHGTVYLGLPPHSPITFYKYRDNKYSSYREVRISDTGSPNVYAYVSTNYRVLVQGGYETWEEAMANNFDRNWLDDLKYLCEPTKYHEKRVTVHLTTQIAITREFNRHRVNSMAEQSTRYCDYSGQGKKFEGVGVNLPSWIDEYEAESTLNAFNSDDAQTVVLHNYCDSISRGESGIFDVIDYWLFANLACEFSYQNLRRLGWTPQQARVVLPLDTNSQLSHTAFVSDWNHFFELRDDKQHAHPDAYELAHPLHEEFKNRNLLK